MGLDQGPAHWHMSWHSSHLRSLPRDSTQPAPLVVLFLAYVFAHCRSSCFPPALSCGSHVPPIRAASAKRPRPHRQPGTNGSTCRANYSARGHVLEGRRRKTHGTKALVHG